MQGVYFPPKNIKYSHGNWFELVVGGLHPAYYTLVIVGAGFYGNSPVWYAKNTWGKSWGEDGYIFPPRERMQVV
ncbi:hypothetical protein RHMOL_Rhmol12G0164700 [Rhododendron molle]|uniref:Uncharacterized protein n=1 Tax=Rhododendron molle TaxID=49168 RepID=A0ACC0LJV6_RHOML|nr:hypothetical protein RHMOL_Rhmol12G0164700 [Rhododendron molle]